MLEGKLLETEERLLEVSRQTIETKMQEETVLTRQWTDHKIQEEANKTTRKIMQTTAREIKDTKAMFNVPGIIGAVSREGTGPEFFSYAEFVVAMFRRHVKQD